MGPRIVSAELEPIVGDAGMILSIWTDDGVRGRGEAVTRAGFAPPLAALEAAARGLPGALLGRSLADLAEAEALAEDACEGAPGPLRFALEGALLDLVGQREGRGVAALLAGPEGPAAAIERSALLVGDDADALAGEIEALRAAGFGTFKIKARGPWPAAQGRVRRARALLGPEAALRVDCNGSMPAADAPALLGALAELDLDYVEEPVAGLAPAGWRALAGAGVRLAIDESATDPRAWRAALDGDAAAVVIVKPAFVGLLAARQRIAEARARGVEVVITSALEGALGVAAAAHLALATATSAPAGISARAAAWLPAWLDRQAPRITAPTAAGLGVAGGEG